MSQIDIKRLGPDDALTFERIADGVFDGPVETRWTRAFLDDKRHHMFVAMEGGLVVGMISAVDYVHPDKPPQLWINEVGVAATHRGRGLAKNLLHTILDVARRLGCREAWVLTDRSNAAALHTYASAGGVETPPDSVMFTFRLDRETTG